MHDLLTTAGHIQPPRGRVRTYRANPETGWAYDRVRGVWLPPGLRPCGAWHSNLVLYDWGAIAGQVLGIGNIAYKLAAIYLEFENLASPSDTVTPPAFNRGPNSGRSYYDGLSASSTRDYIRIPIIAPQLISSDPVLYPSGNRLIVFGLAAGTVGVHGKPYTNAANSKAYGAALVASPNPADLTNDIVLSRNYFATGEQQLKLTASQTGIEWELTFE